MHTYLRSAHASPARTCGDQRAPVDSPPTGARSFRPPIEHCTECMGTGYWHDEHDEARPCEYCVRPTDPEPERE